MNLKWPSPASSVIRLTKARAAAGSRYSSTKRISVSLPLRRLLELAGTGFDLGRLELGCQRPPALVDELAHQRKETTEQVSETLGRGDGLPRLLEFLATLVSRTGAE